MHKMGVRHTFIQGPLPRQPGAVEEAGDFRKVDRGAIARDDEGAADLAGPGARHGDDRDFGDRGMAGQRVLDFLGADVLARADDDILRSAGDVETAFLNESEVTSAQIRPGPRSLDPRMEGAFGVLGSTPVAHGDARAGQPDLAHQAVRQVESGGRVDDLEVVGWTPPCESGHGRWTLDVWWLTEMAGPIGKGYSFLVELVAPKSERVVGQRPFTLRFG